MLTLNLQHVTQKFPIGQTVKLYRGIVDNSGVPRPVGAPIASAVVAADESLTFENVPEDQRTYWAAWEYLQEGTGEEVFWNLIQVTAPVNETPALIGPGPKGEAGLLWRGAWSNATAYNVNDAVTLGGASYRCKTGHTNHEPPNAAFWELLAEKGTNGAAGATGATGLSAAPFQVAGKLEGNAGAGTRTFAVTGGLTALEGGVANQNSMVYLKAGTKYKARTLVGTGETAPAVAIALGIKRVTGMNNAFFAFAAEQAVLNIAKLSTVKVTVETEAEFEVATSGWYAVMVKTTEATAAGSAMAIHVSIGQ